MEKKKTKVLPAVIRNKATVKGWLDYIENNSCVFAFKNHQTLMRESNYLTIFRLCAKVAVLKNHTS